MMIAARARLLLALPLLLFPIVGCDSTTGLDEMSLVSTWDGVGSLQTIDAGRGLKLLIGAHAGGTISGSWTKSEGSGQGSGSIAGVATEDDEIRLTLQGFLGDDPTFAGWLTDQHRMSGTMNAVDLDGSAVFRRRSVGLP